MQFIVQCIIASSIVYALPPATTGVPANERIIGGQAAAENAFPSVVSLEILLPQGRGLCGGTLINSQAIVTAGHCLYDYSSQSPVPPSIVQVGYGNNNRLEQTYVRAQQIHLHPQFDPLETQNDIGLVIIDPISSFNASVQPATIYNGQLPQGTELTAVGWGLTSAIGTSDNLPDMLQQTNIVVGQQATCRELVPEYDSSDGPQICTQNSLHIGSDTCQGDSGTGVFITSNGRSFLAGLTSYGSSPDGDPTCALDNGLAVYTHVYYYRDFLDQFAGAVQNGRRRPVQSKLHEEMELRHHHHKHHHKHHHHHHHHHKGDDSDSDNEDSEASWEHEQTQEPDHTWQPDHATWEPQNSWRPEHTWEPQNSWKPEHTWKPDHMSSSTLSWHPDHSQTPDQGWHKIHKALKSKS